MLMVPFRYQKISFSWQGFGEDVGQLGIQSRTKKWLENVLVLVLMEYLWMEHLGQWKLTRENRLKPQLMKQQLLELEKHQLMED
ncbi:hypothetical protein Tco_0963047 [Tanacetum coccineum]